MYLTYFKREFAKKHGNCGVLAGFVLFLSGIKRRGLFIPLIVIFVIRIDDGKFGNGIYFRNLPRKHFVNG